VLELDPPARMVWSWAGGNIDTTVTFTLEPAGTDRTRLRLHQVGFHGLGGQLTRRILAGGYPRLLGQRLPAWLDQQAGASTGPGGTEMARPPRLAGGPATVNCAEGWRAYLGIVRRWRDAANS
jgi:uncharacterized protein YndB with AHSA1/START domain